MSCTGAAAEHEPKRAQEHGASRHGSFNQYQRLQGPKSGKEKVDIENYYIVDKVTEAKQQRMEDYSL